MNRWQGMPPHYRLRPDGGGVWGWTKETRPPRVPLLTAHIARLIFGNVCMFRRNSSFKVVILGTMRIITNKINKPCQ